MLELIIIALVVFWIIALMAKKTLGGCIHVLLFIAAAVLIYRLMQA